MTLKKELKSEIVNLSTIKEYFSEDTSFLIELITAYLSDTIPRIEIIEKSLTEVDYIELKNVSHFLKSSFGLMGIKCLEEIIELENLAKIEAPKKIIHEKLNFIIPICRESIVEYECILKKIKNEFYYKNQ
ncbi:hypothetical protein BTO04_14535 [Polaribacter sp. SA4-10]|uniref:Hpt domain-containing protein n=1 Tax=Polaribacter sp. SA4-10 TaxID=754397 RepID=UPI000B3CD0FF|nr:Hpt domain-containing protein [Polaribacter sp. SA4-10]ARV07839.1 hypothetical protein BTO04_14535 [Polaribacter sp. SA4-10]